jgi:hypothetical protein
MNIVHAICVSTVLAALYSQLNESDIPLVAMWADDRPTAAIHKEKPGSKYTHRMVIDHAGLTIRKWGTWSEGSFQGAAIGAVPSTMSGISTLVSTLSSRGRLTCHDLSAYGIAPETELEWRNPALMRRVGKGSKSHVAKR